MRGVVQRVTGASVRVEQTLVGAIERGLLVLLGVEAGDTDQDVRYLAGKTAGLRVFCDEQGLMNRSITDCGGAVLVVSQFTLLGDVRRGRRPSFISAAEPDRAEQLVADYCLALTQAGLHVEQGRFRADMQVASINDGPVTILLDSRKLF